MQQKGSRSLEEAGFDLLQMKHGSVTEVVALMSTREHVYPTNFFNSLESVIGIQIRNTMILHILSHLLQQMSVSQHK